MDCGKMLSCLAVVQGGDAKEQGGFEREQGRGMRGRGMKPTRLPQTPSHILGRLCNLMAS